MRGFDRLLQDVDLESNVAENQAVVLTNSTCFWVSYGLFMATIGAVSMWAFFRFIVMA
jgi:hypothetical protein